MTPKQLQLYVTIFEKMGRPAKKIGNAMFDAVDSVSFARNYDIFAIFYHVALKSNG